jgi:hypothetical protein
MIAMREIALFLLVMAMWGCAPKVGSPEWCDAMDEKPKGEWTANEVGDYARHCVFRKSED